MRARCVVVALLLAGCGRCGGSGAEPSPDTNRQLPPEPPHGVVVGHITFAADVDAGLPYYPDYMIPTPMGNAPPPNDCPAPRLADRQPVRMDAQNRGLVGVMVAATEFDRTSPPHADPTTRDVDIRDCNLTPGMLVANVGDTLRISNHSSYPYFPSASGFGGTTTAVIHDQAPREIPLDHPAITQLGCSAFGVQCGRTDLIVLQNPVWTMTEASGSYRLGEVPPGEHVEIHAWHPLFAEASATISLHDGETKTVDLVLRPAPLPAPPEPPPPHDPNQIGDIH